MTTSTPTTANTTPRNSRRWFQFSLRILLIVVSIVAVAMGLLMRYVDQQREIVRLEKEAVAEIEKLGGSVKYADQAQPVLAGLPSWLRTILEDEEYRPVTGVTLLNDFIMDADLAQLSKLTSLKALLIANSSVTEAGLIHLSELSTLEEFYLHEDSITVEGLAKLRTILPNCYIERFSYKKRRTREYSNDEL